MPEDAALVPIRQGGIVRVARGVFVGIGNAKLVLVVDGVIALEVDLLPGKVSVVAKNIFCPVPFRTHPTVAGCIESVADVEIVRSRNLPENLRDISGRVQGLSVGIKISTGVDDRI